MNFRLARLLDDYIENRRTKASVPLSKWFQQCQTIAEQDEFLASVKTVILLQRAAREGEISDPRDRTP
jgi:hypothetical protein